MVITLFTKIALPKRVEVLILEFAQIFMLMRMSSHVEHSYLRSGLLITDSSDHLPIFSISLDHMRTHQRQESLFVRDKSEQNISNFLEELDCIDWSNLDGYNDPKICYSKFLERYTKTYEKHFPLKKLKHRLHSRRPWISQGLLKSIKHKNKLYKRYLSNPSPQKELIYKTYKNKLNHSLRIAKRLYYDKKLNESKSNIRATWSLLNEVLNNKKLRPKPNSVFKVDDQEISDPMEIANRFCYSVILDQTLPNGFNLPLSIKISFLAISLSLCS